MGKRIRYPKNKKQEEIKKEEEKKELEQKQEQTKHFVLDVHDSIVTELSGFGH